MFPTAKKLPVSNPTPEKTSILLISPHAEDHSILLSMLEQSGVSICHASNTREASDLLDREAPSIIVCERDLPDGSWKDILNRAENAPKIPLLLVTSRQADESLWAEVLNLGGYDVLLKPFDRSEVTRVVSMACRPARANLTPQPF
jgi:DNA-binding response OmpR family regulator